jgi:hypothetical protein
MISLESMMQLTDFQQMLAYFRRDLDTDLEVLEAKPDMRRDLFHRLALIASQHDDKLAHQSKLLVVAMSHAGYPVDLMAFGTLIGHLKLWLEDKGCDLSRKQFNDLIDGVLDFNEEEAK